MEQAYETLLEAFENSVVLYREKNALVVQGEAFTYEQIYGIACKQALFLLKKLQKKRLKRVAIFAYRNFTSYVGVLVALMTGAAFIPLNPKFPTGRNISILEACKPEVIITDEDFLQELTQLVKNTDISTLIFSANSSMQQLEEVATVQESLVCTFLPKPLPEEDAYILFTSGSTGKPKGVPIQHKNVCSFLQYNQRRYCIRDSDRLSQTFDQTFDLSIFDLFMSWCHGACLYGMRPIDLLSPSKYINENKITVWFSVPSIISLLCKQEFLKESIFPSLRLSLFCGEPLLESQIAAWADAAPNSICENLYGPTELTVACSVYRWARNEENITYNGILSIGSMYEHMEYVLLDEDSNLVTQEGELCVAGEQMFQGYLDSNIKSADYFLCLDCLNMKKKIYYKTGDRVRITSTGDMLYLGRVDQQVKINGYRVELAEIESLLVTIVGVSRAFVFCLIDSSDRQTKNLAAYVVGDITLCALIEKCKAILPNYMIPSKIKIAKDFPLNVNGKADRKSIEAQFDPLYMERENIQHEEVPIVLAGD